MVIKIVLTSLLSLILLFCLTKLNGNKQISELTMFDYIVSITIGSIAAELATELEEPIRPIVAILVYGMGSVVITVATQKSIRLRRLIFGRATILFNKGKFYRENLKKARVDINEFLLQARTNGYFDLSTIKTAIMETSGKISFLPYSDERPVIPKDMGLNPIEEEVLYNVIIDRKVLIKNLTAAGKNTAWLKNELKNQGKKAEEIMLATLDTKGKLSVFMLDNQKIKNDIFQ